MAVFFAAAGQVVVHLARAGYHALDLVSLLDDFFLALGNDRLEATLGELVEGGRRILGTQQRLGRHDHQGLAQVAHHLAAQHVEDLAGRGGLDDLHVGVSGQLHEALKARRTVLRTLTFIAVRQHQRDAVHTAPFDFTGGDELVNHHLRTVGEITKLRFPDHEGVGVVRGIAIFKCKHRLFRQDGVNHHKRCLIGGHVLQRGVGTFVKLFTVLVMDDRMTVREGAAPAVFTAQAHRVAAGYQRGKGHVLAHAPVHHGFTPAHGGSVCIDLLHQVVRCDAVRDGGDSLGQALPLGHGDGSVTRVRPLFIQVR